MSWHNSYARVLRVLFPHLSFKADTYAAVVLPNFVTEGMKPNEENSRKKHRTKCANEQSFTARSHSVVLPVDTHSPISYKPKPASHRSHYLLSPSGSKHLCQTTRTRTYTLLIYSSRSLILVTAPCHPGRAAAGNSARCVLLKHLWPLSGSPWSFPSEGLCVASAGVQSLQHLCATGWTEPVFGRAQSRRLL